MSTIAELRKQLFATLEGLNSKEAPMDIERAKVVAEVAQVIINSAKAEVDFIRATGEKGTGFIAPAQPPLPPGIVGVTQHRMRG